MWWRLLRRTGSVVVVVSTAAMACAFGAAGAATLGGLAPGTVYSSDAAVTAGAPTILGCDNFALAASTGAGLAGRPAQLPANCGGASWAVHLGTWTITGGQLQARTRNASATLDASRTDVSAQATVLDVNGGGNAAAGVAIDHSGASRVFLAGVVASGNQAELRLVNGGSVTTLATGAVAVSATSVVRLTRVGTAVTLQVNGATVVSHTLTPAQASLLTGTRAGLYWGRGNAVRFADFLVTQAAP